MENSRRNFMKILISGVASGAVFTVFKVSGAKALPRPPASLVETEFLKHCTRCYRCIDICPADALAPASIFDGIVFIADCRGFVHCIDAETGKAFWIHDTEGEIWASTLIADGKVYIGTRKKLLWILAAEKEKKVIAKIKLDTPTASTPVAANSTLYITTMHKLYAIKK